MLDIIARHLPAQNLKAKIHENIHSVCAYSGEAITRGVLLKDVLANTFTDHKYLRYESEYVSLPFALCLSEVLPNSKGNGFNALRSYSLYASGKELRFLKREEGLDLLLNLPAEVPYYFIITYNSKKHTSFKARINYDTALVYVQTDLSDEPVVVQKSEVLAYLPTIQAWYTVVAGKEGVEQAPTYFTKDQILGNTSLDQLRMAQYGLEKALQENEFLDSFRASPAFKLIVHLLNKSLCPVSK